MIEPPTEICADLVILKNFCYLYVTIDYGSAYARSDTFSFIDWNRNDAPRMDAMPDIDTDNE